MSTELEICSIAVAEKFEWGNNCSVWTLVDEKNLTIMQEKMPPNSRDEMHYHNECTQFVYILSGILEIEMNNRMVCLQPFEGLKIPKKMPHRVINNSNKEVNFLLVSVPGHTEDRVLCNNPS